MIESIRFRNFKALKDATLPLGPFTLLVGPNGSGKSTALQALWMAATQQGGALDSIKAVGATENPYVEITSPQRLRKLATFNEGGAMSLGWGDVPNAPRTIETHVFQDQLMAMRFYSFDAEKLAQRVPLRPQTELGRDGTGLAAVLDQLRDRDPERFEALNNDLHMWLPEFDRVLFETPQEGMREIRLRLSGTTRGIRATELSHGTLLALALLTLANLDRVPPFVSIEEPDRGVHPRLLRRVQDALYRLAFPKEYKSNRPPVQVVATTHSPLLLDLFRDHPEQVVVAEKKGGTAEFVRLVDRLDLKELLSETQLGDLWYAGLLGGVPSEP